MSSIFGKQISEQQSQSLNARSSKIVVTADSRSKENAIKNYKVSSVNEAKSLGRNLAMSRDKNTRD